MIEVIRGSVSTSFRCKKCGEIMPFKWEGTPKELRQKKLFNAIKNIKHECK